MRRIIFSLLLVLSAQVVVSQVEDLSHWIVEKKITKKVIHTKGLASFQTASTSFTGNYNGIVLHGWDESYQRQGYVRFLEHEVWSEWLPLYITRSATSPSFLAAYRSEHYRDNEPFEIKFEGESEAYFYLSQIGTFNNKFDSQEELREIAHNYTQTYTLSNVTPPVLHRRAEWNAASFIGTPSPLANTTNYANITFHHAAGFSASNLEEGKVQLKAIQEFHQNGRGWSDIGYHFVIDKAGNLYQGRPFQNEPGTWEDGPRLVLGAHAGGANTSNIGVCLLGCYHPPEASYPCNDVITDSSYDTYVNLFAFLRQEYGVTKNNIYGHRDFGTTSCPGDNNYALLPQLRVDVDDLLLTGNAPFGQLQFTAEETNGIVVLTWEVLVNESLTNLWIERTVDGTKETLATFNTVENGSFVDTGLTQEGIVNYSLWGANAEGRKQRLGVGLLSLENPTEFLITENFPNPFQNTTTLRYYLDQEGFVQLKVFNALGQEVQVLVNEFQEEGQWYGYSFSGELLPAGVYFYQLDVEGFAGSVFSSTGKMLLIK